MNEKDDDYEDFIARAKNMCRIIQNILDLESFSVGMSALESLLVANLIGNSFDKEECLQRLSETWDEQLSLNHEIFVERITEKVAEIEKRLGIKHDH